MHRSQNISEVEECLYFKGVVDEVGIWHRTLSPTEMSDLYKRGALKIKTQVRACSTSDCSGVDFVGPGGDSSLFFSELTNTTNTLPLIDAGSAAGSGQYFQYRHYFESYDTTLSPKLKDTGISTLAP